MRIAFGMVFLVGCSTEPSSSLDVGIDVAATVDAQAESAALEDGTTSEHDSSTIDSTLADDSATFADTTVTDSVEPEVVVDDVAPFEAGECVPVDADIPPSTCDSSLFCASGSVTTTSPYFPVPCVAHVSIVWEVTWVTDHSYKWGDGSSADKSFSLPFASPPPPEAFNANPPGIDPLFAVGFFALGAAIPEGPIKSLKGYSLAPLHAVIYRQPGSSSPPSGWSWLSAFPEGYSCARATPPPDGSTFCEFVPVPCSEVYILMGNHKIPNWT